MEMITEERLVLTVNTLLKISQKRVKDFGDYAIVLVTARGEDYWGGRTIYPEKTKKTLSSWTQPYKLPNTAWDIEILGPLEDYPEYTL